MWNEAVWFPLALLTLIAGSAAAQSPPEAAEVVKTLGFPADSKQKILAGEYVETALETASERDLNVGIAFLSKGIGPEPLAQEVVGQDLADRSDPQTLAFGRFSDPGSLADLAKLKLTKGQQAAYSEPAEWLNLSEQEVAALEKASGDPMAVQKAVHAALLARYQAYRQKGIAGIAPYERGSRPFEPGKDIESANDAARRVGLLPDSFLGLLDHYPQGAPDDLVEAFSWSQFDAHGQDTLALTHHFTGTFGSAVLVVQRQFYASNGYNVEQAVTGLLPVKEGTLVVYANHTSTDQVAGFGGSAKRGIGRKFMAAQLEQSFERSKETGEK